MERIAELVGLVVVRVLVAGAGVLDVVTARAVFQQLAVDVGKALRPIARTARGVSSRRPSRCSMSPASSSIFVRSRSRSSDCAASSPSNSRRAVEVDLGELARLRCRTQQVLEVVEVAERVEQAGHLTELQRVVATETL